MTVSATHTKVVYQGDGETRKWPYTFSLAKGNHLAVYVSDQDGKTGQIQSNFQVNLLENAVVYPLEGEPLKVGEKIALLRRTPLTQELDLVNNGGFFPENIESAFDRAVLVEQELREELDRAVKMPETGSGSGDFTHEILGARVRAEQAASRAESIKNDAEEIVLQGEQFFQNTEAEANRARNEADRAEKAAEEALGGGIRTVNGISGAEIELTSEDIGAAPKEHIHDIMEKIPEIKEENAGKSLIVNEMGTGCEWETVSGVPVGAIIAWAGNTPPIGYLECNGATLRKETYPGLFAAIGTLWGSESEDTFKLPDFYSAARFLRSRSDGLDVGEVQEDAIREIEGTFNANGNRKDIGGYVASGVFEGYNAGSGHSAGYIGSGWGLRFKASKVVPTADENRPKNAAVMYCIKVTYEYVNPNQVDISAVAQEIAGLEANKVSQSEVQKLTGTRLWRSDVDGGRTDIRFGSGIVLEIEHGLSIEEPLDCSWDLQLVCLNPDGGYQAGDIAMGFSNHNNDYGQHPRPSLSKTTISVRWGSHAQGVTMIGKSVAAFNAIAANWLPVFRIWY